LFYLLLRRLPRPTLFPYTTLFRSLAVDLGTGEVAGLLPAADVGNGLTDAQVSDTLTCSIFRGSGSTTDAIDLATAEVAGNLGVRSEEHTSELQSRFDLVCRLLLEK